jgi:hypothetical protein
MRVGLFVSGLVLLLIGFWFTFLFGFGAIVFGFPLIIVGLIVVALVLFAISYGYARYRKRHAAPA